MPDQKSFGAALDWIKSGGRAQRDSWDHEGAISFIFLVPGSTFRVNRPPLAGIYPKDTPINYHAHIDCVMDQGFVMPWSPTQDDLLSDDWLLLDAPKHG